MSDLAAAMAEQKTAQQVLPAAEQRLAAAKAGADRDEQRAAAQNLRELRWLARGGRVAELRG